MTSEQLDMLHRCTYGVDINKLPSDEMEILLWLADKNLCRPFGDLLESTIYVLTQDGATQLKSVEDTDNDRAEQERKYNEQIAKADEDRKKQFRHDWGTAIVSAVFGAVLTLIVEHFSDILAFFSGLSH